MVIGAILAADDSIVFLFFVSGDYQNIKHIGRPSNTTFVGRSWSQNSAVSIFRSMTGRSP